MPRPGVGYCPNCGAPCRDTEPASNYGAYYHPQEESCANSDSYLYEGQLSLNRRKRNKRRRVT